MKNRRKVASWRRSVRALALGVVLGAPGCVADRGGPTPDAGGDAPDATEAAVVCPAVTGGNDVSFDVDCSGSCALHDHLDFHFDPGSAAFPACGVAQGNLILADFSSAEGPLHGTFGASLNMDVTPYAGQGSYKLASSNVNNDLLFSFSAQLACPKGGIGGTAQLSVVIANGSQASEGGAGATCTVVVDTDCVTHPQGTHTVLGTLSCSFDDPIAGSCVLSHGKLRLAGCIP